MSLDAIVIPKDTRPAALADMESRSLIVGSAAAQRARREPTGCWYPGGKATERKESSLMIVR